MDGRLLLTGLREKDMPSVPTPDALVNISRYVLPPTVIELVRGHHSLYAPKAFAES